MSDDFSDPFFYDEPAATVTAPRAPVAATGSATTAHPIRSAAYLLKPDAEWTAENLRDYVVSEIERCTGPLRNRNAITEMAIFRSFMTRWGHRAPAIARTAFTVHKGWWGNSEIGINRFCKNSDPYFAQKIAANLPQDGSVL